MSGSIFTRVAKIRNPPVLIFGPRLPVHAVSRRNLLKMLLMAKCLTPAIQRCNRNIAVQPFRGIAEPAARMTTTLTSRVVVSRIETLTPLSSNWLLLLRDTQRASETVFKSPTAFAGPTLVDVARPWKDDASHTNQRPRQSATAAGATAGVALHAGPVADQRVVLAFAAGITLVALHLCLVAQGQAAAGRHRAGRDGCRGRLADSDGARHVLRHI
jgi:hypothetical protein